MWGLPKVAVWISAAIAAAAITGVIVWQAGMPPPSMETAATPAAPASGSQASTRATPKIEPMVSAVEPAPAKEAASVAAPPAAPVAAAVGGPAAPSPEASAAKPEVADQSATLSQPVVPGPTVDGPAPLPQFDVVRVEPDGSAVIAGRAAPEAAVVLLDHGSAFDRATADGAGQFALLPKPLAPGEHLLSLRIVSKDGNYADSAQNVTVWIPPTGKGDLLVALTSPGEPTRILSDTAQPSPLDRSPAAPRPPLAIRTAEIEGQGSFFATGLAPAGAKILLYLNNAFVASVTASADNQWSLKVEKGMRPGGYTIRADQVDGGSGRVVARAEAPFNYPATPRFVQNQSDPQASLIPVSPAANNRVSQASSAPAAPPSTGMPAATAPTGGITSAPAQTAIPLGPSQPASPPLAASAAIARPEAAAQTPVAGQSVRPFRQIPGSQVQTAQVRNGRGAATQATIGQALVGRPQSDQTQSVQSQAGGTPTSAAGAPGSPAAKRTARQQRLAPSAVPEQPQQAETPPNEMAMATESDAKANAVVKELGTALVERGDSLWRISRKVYGRGMRYTQIYEANAIQIRNPDLIYPGQIFVVPSSPAN
jgi:nucleoid-associated protein YgaU